MKIINIFPDYMSTGFWDGETGSSIHQCRFEGVLTHADFMALKYWHSIWEFHTDDDWNTTTLSPSFWWDWEEDGKRLVDDWNSKQDVYQFVYVE